MSILTPELLFKSSSLLPSFREQRIQTLFRSIIQCASRTCSGVDQRTEGTSQPGCAMASSFGFGRHSRGVLRLPNPLSSRSLRRYPLSLFKKERFRLETRGGERG